MIRIISAVIMGLLIGSTWFQLGLSQQDISDKNGYLFFTVIFIGFTEMNDAVTQFPEVSQLYCNPCKVKDSTSNLNHVKKEREIFLHEQAAGVYMVSAYYISKVIADLPLRLIAPFIYVIISYWMVGLDSDPGKFFMFLGCCWMMSIAFSSFGLAVSAAAKSAQVAIAVSTVLLTFFVVFGGFFIAPDNIPGYFPPQLFSSARLVYNSN